LAKAFWNRCRGGQQEEVARGVMRVDFFGEDVVLMGFVNGKNGMWEMKTTKNDSRITGVMNSRIPHV